MEISQCCNNEKIVEVIYHDWNNEKPVFVCDKHWHLKNEVSEFHWQKWTKQVRFLTENEIMEATVPQ